ncbi:c-type cytochrome biogenesis protein CcsB [Microbacterium amylolyticum]|uniref:Cytochrome c-type biogenesis protein CcsB n=1 Tax=Microbacterium amylolyticum TaxID=936337 RepID=A0ABS4ZJ64_9MICO|nr:c-type cytochrome biogenesis protein CcsB [Microbacterium amylolyticum]MBP2437338.1 cytochrome c-type biogenesis protein CcsB [Microbacterium amylolyticum]
MSVVLLPATIAWAPSANAAVLDSWSRVMLWTAIAVYVFAFIAYAVDLANRAGATAKARDRVGAAGEAMPAVPQDEGTQRPERRVMARVGATLTWMAFLLHLGATIFRGLGAGHVPWSNMYEFAMTGTLLMTAVYLGTLFWRDLRFLGTFMTGLITVLLGSSIQFYTQIVPLMDPLQSAWLVVHVFVASLSTAFLALAFALSVLQLLQARREAKAEAPARSLLRTLPAAETLENLSYRLAIIGFVFWTFTLIAGAIWAQESWGRYWGFDTKEVWTFIIWVLYAGYIHARATRGWRGTRSAWLSIVGFVAVIFNFTIVNMFFEGLHAYSGLN